MDEDIFRERRSPIARFMYAVFNVFDVPVTYVRENIVKPNQKHYPWYHEKFRRVPTVDECYSDDGVCIQEADVQFKRDKLVDEAIVKILRSRYEQCLIYHNPDKYLCDDIYKQYEEAATNWFIKYGDMGVYATAKNALMKQKHRMAWERRHGPVGTGMKTEMTVE